MGAAKGAGERMGRRLGLSAVLAIALVGAWLAGRAAPRQGGEQSAPPARRPLIVFMTDFGTANDAVAICKGVILTIAPDVRIIDLTHQVTPFSIPDGARFLYGATPYYPPGTVFLVVVDPGVGTARKAVVIKSQKGQFFVLPDNGLITRVADRDGLVGARDITNPAWMIGAKISSTFHGRDIFSPAAAHLAEGWDWTQVGPPVPLDQLVRYEPPKPTIDAKGIRGEVVALDDPFGSLITNILAPDFLKLGYRRGDLVRVRVGSHEFTAPFVKTFGDVPIGHILAYVDSRGRIELALNQKNFSETYQIKPPVPIFIPIHEK
jgi:S-adenosyl-L-methionine hydrolase (adenosine-forming)